MPAAAVSLVSSQFVFRRSLVDQRLGGVLMGFFLEPPDIAAFSILQACILCAFRLRKSSQQLTARKRRRTRPSLTKRRISSPLSSPFVRLTAAKPESKLFQSWLRAMERSFRQVGPAPILLPSPTAASRRTSPTWISLPGPSFHPLETPTSGTLL